MPMPRPLPIDQFRAQNLNRIVDLPSAAEYHVFIDESGEIFRRFTEDEKAKHDHANHHANHRANHRANHHMHNKKTHMAGNMMGRFAAVIMPENPDFAALPPLPIPFHCTDLYKEGFRAGLTRTHISQVINQAMQQLVDSKCAIFGISIEALQNTAGQQWFAGTIETIAWILRLLQVNQHQPRYTLYVYIEQRGKFQESHDLIGAAELLLQDLSKTYPDRYQHVQLKVSVISKEDAIAPYAAYADVVAFTWLQTRPESKDLLDKSDLVGTCLLDGIDAKDLRDAWDSVANARNKPEDWLHLIGQIDIQSDDYRQSLLTVLMKPYGERIKENPHLWSILVQKICDRLHGSTLNNRILQRQITWLSQFQPNETKIPPKAQLLFYIAALSLRNHLGQAGQTEEEIFVKLGELIDTLYHEEIRLALTAALHLSSQHSNKLLFGIAKGNLQYWLPPEDTYKERQLRLAAYGYTLTGRLYSALGQYTAGLQQHEYAKDFFIDALQCFDHVSNPPDVIADRQKTLSYVILHIADTHADINTDLYPNRSIYLQEVLHYIAQKLDPHAYRAGQTLYYVDTLIAFAGQNKAVMHPEIRNYYRYQQQNLLHYLYWCGTATEKEDYITRFSAIYHSDQKQKRDAEREYEREYESEHEQEYEYEYEQEHAILVDHPWGSIYFWRAVLSYEYAQSLLQDADKQAQTILQQAKEQLQDAIMANADAKAGPVLNLAGFLYEMWGYCVGIHETILADCQGYWDEIKSTFTPRIDLLWRECMNLAEKRDVSAFLRKMKEMLPLYFC